MRFLKCSLLMIELINHSLFSFADIFHHFRLRCSQFCRLRVHLTVWMTAVLCLLMSIVSNCWCCSFCSVNSAPHILLHLLPLSIPAINVINLVPITSSVGLSLALSVIAAIMMTLAVENNIQSNPPDEGLCRLQSCCSLCHIVATVQIRSLCVWYSLGWC